MSMDKGVNATAVDEDMLDRPTEAEAIASLREYALGPIKAVFTWSEAAVVLELIEALAITGYDHLMFDETGRCIERKMDSDEKHPFGIQGTDFSKSFRVETRPLYARSITPAEGG